MESAPSRVLARFGFALPEAYLRLEAAGRLDAADPTRGLWLDEAEWIPPGRIADHKFQDHAIPGLVPFAFSGRGDLWCWWPAAAEGGIAPVALCPDDSDQGELYAPDLEGFLYRRVVEYADGAWDDGAPEDEDAARRRLRTYPGLLAGVLDPARLAFLGELARRPVTPLPYARSFLREGEADARVRRDLAFARLGEEFTWMA